MKTILGSSDSLKEEEESNTVTLSERERHMKTILGSGDSIKEEEFSKN